MTKRQVRSLKEMKQCILDNLETNKYQPMTKIAELSRLNYFRCKSLLLEMKEQNLVEETNSKTGCYSYWRKK